MSPKLISILALVGLLLVAAALAPIVRADTAVPAAETVNQADILALPTAQEGETGGSNLPEGLSRIFASLGLYIVTMFTMAVGTEIVVDALKLALGFKSKPTAQESVAKYEAVLPGAMSDLGLAAEARQSIENQAAAMKKLLKPVFQAEQVLADLKEENFSQALTAVAGEGAQQKSVAHLTAAAKNQVAAALNNLPPNSVMAQAVTENVRLALNELIDKIGEEAADVTPESLFRQAKVAVNGKLADAVMDWAGGQVETLTGLTYQEARRTYDDQIGPLLRQSGLSKETEEKISRQFETHLENLRINQHAQVFLDSLNDLLLEVELQRDQLSSHWRRWTGRFLAWVNSWGKWTAWIPSRMKSPLDPTIHEPGQAASTLLKIARRDKEESSARVQQLRLTSVLIGIILAYFLQIDSADLLRDLLPGTANFLKVSLLTQDAAIFNWFGNLVNIEMHTLTAGVVLTGLAASAGSGFWHDQLSRLQSIQKGVETAYTAIQPVVAISSGEEPPK